MSAVLSSHKAKITLRTVILTFVERISFVGNLLREEYIYRGLFLRVLCCERKGASEALNPMSYFL